MNKNIIIVTVVIIAGFVAWLIYNKKKTGSYKPSFLQSGSLSIPQKVQDNLDAFSEGEKFKFEGRTYQVVNGAWQIA